MIRRSITLTLMLTFACGLYAQEQKSILQLAEEAYAREEYAVAGALYQRQARSKGDRTPVPLLMKMARSYQEIGLFGEAAGVYRQVIARSDRPASAYFAYGEALRQLEQYDSARQQYALFTTTNADSLQLKTIALQSCDSAVVWLARPAPVELQPLKELNTPGSDLVSGVIQQGLLLMSNGYRGLVLNGGAEKNPRTDLRTQHPFYKAYAYQQYTQGNATMYLEELAPKLLGGFDYHIGPVCLSNNEDTLYATINLQGKDIALTSRKGPVNGVRQLQLYQSIKKDGRWSELVLLPGINVAGYSSSHAVLNDSGNILYFVSDRPGGLGQSDLWYAEKQADGNWGAPVNCGSRINTLASETFPTVNEEGILYFSSKGYAGLGGYDIYRVKGEKSDWETPENMKAPFNTGADDIGLVLKQNGYQGYLSSNKKGGMGLDDIYYFEDAGYIHRVNHRSPDAILHRPAGEKDPYAPARPTTGSGTEGPSLVKRPLTTEEEADKRQLEQLKFLYDYNSAGLLTESRQLLDQVAGILQRRPDWKIVIASFADNRGGDQYNTDLSALRCFAVIDYLSRKGIDPKRLYYSNKGELEPVNKCKDGVPCSEEEYRENRRSELKVKW